MKRLPYETLLASFSSWLLRLNYAKGTIGGRRRQLKFFLTWLTSQEISNLSEVELSDLLNYNAYLHNRAIGWRTISSYLSCLKLLNIYLESHGESPLVLLKFKVEKGIVTSRNILSKKEIKALYAVCEPTIWGLRDEALLALYYGCGLRCTEGINLELQDVDLSKSLLHVRRGKNYRSRYVPLSRGVVLRLKNWLEYGQGWFGGRKTNVLLPNQKGEISNGSGLNKRLKLLCKKAGIEKGISLHCLRHSIATHLLESGMSIEHISQFLGHKGLEATQLYTRIIPEKSKADG